jgi:sugar lactone lactonase YvrE
MDASVEVAVSSGCELGEGPVWDEASGILYWVDILAGRFHRFEPGTGLTTLTSIGEPIGAVALVNGGGLIAAVERGFAHLSDTGAEPVGPRVVPPGRRMNDGKCDPLGRFWAGSMAYDLTAGAGSLYRLEHDGAVTTVLDGVTISNGVDWSADGRRMYYVDSATRRIDVFDFELETGDATNRRPFATIEPPGLPDGLTVDADGCVWVAIWDGWEVLRFSADGHLEGRIALPVAQATSVTFGGSDLSTLYITTASEGLTERQRVEQPLAGHVLACRPGCQGEPAGRYHHRPGLSGGVESDPQHRGRGIPVRPGSDEEAREQLETTDVLAQERWRVKG